MLVLSGDYLTTGEFVNVATVSHVGRVDVDDPESLLTTEMVLQFFRATADQSGQKYPATV